MTGTENEWWADLGERVKWARTFAGLTQIQLAERAGLTRASIANLERGRQRITAYRVEQIARAVKVPASRLWPGRSQG